MAALLCMHSECRLVVYYSKTPWLVLHSETRWHRMHSACRWLVFGYCEARYILAQRNTLASGA